MNQEYIDFRKDLKSYFIKNNMFGIHNTNNYFVYVDELGISYDIENDIVSLVSFNFSKFDEGGIDIVVPDFIDNVCDNFGGLFKYDWIHKIRSLEFGHSLKYIGINAFSGFDNLESVIADGVNFCGNSAFNSCYKLQSVSMENVKKINKECFMDCYQLKDLYIPNVEYIYAKAFKSCCNLRELNLNNLIYLDNNVFTDTNISKLYLDRFKIRLNYYALDGIDSSCITFVN